MTAASRPRMRWLAFGLTGGLVGQQAGLGTWVFVVTLTLFAIDAWHVVFGSDEG